MFEVTYLADDLFIYIFCPIFIVMMVRCPIIQAHVAARMLSRLTIPSFGEITSTLNRTSSGVVFLVNCLNI